MPMKLQKCSWEMKESGCFCAWQGLTCIFYSTCSRFLVSSVSNAQYMQGFVKAVLFY